ncbi:MAG: hypothetical protein K1X88_16585 [Nannocystaceae bacterium]|nr:hypothetical protein [Nannocystaceae bacterium]
MTAADPRRPLIVLVGAALAACHVEAGARIELGGSTSGGTGVIDDDDGSDAPGEGSGSGDASGDGETTAGPGEGSSSGTPDTTTGEPQWLGVSPGCGSEPGAITSGVIDVGGTERQFIIELPQGYDNTRPYPLVFGYHGLTENMSTAQARFRISQEWQGQAIAIYPNGRPLAGFGGANGFEYGNPNGVDIDFFDALATQAANELCVDLDRIFVEGFSDGGYFTDSLMCYRAPYVRAAAFGGAGLGGTATQHENCGGPVPAWGMHGMTDEVVPYHYGIDARDFWIEENGCGQQTVPVEPTQFCAEYQGCEGENTMIWCDSDQGHWWVEDWASPAAAAFFQRFDSPNSP